MPARCTLALLASNAKAQVTNQKYFGVASKTAEARNSHAKGRRAQTPSPFGKLRVKLLPIFFQHP
ncbi:TPA: hypothetical protein DDX30_00615 [Candidatus Wolfebacteria bacterium]|nr:hypothetical protein [Candidatus Wolfebacteria bacterium]